MNTLRTTFALALAVGLVAPALSAQQQAAAQEQAGSRQIVVTVLGMSCPFCVYGVQQKLQKLEGVTELEVELETGLATLTVENDADISNDVLVKTVKDAGFEAAKIVRNFESEFPDFERKPSG